MAAIVDEIIFAGDESAEVAVTPGLLLGFNASAPCTVLAKNAAADPARWGVIYQCRQHDDARWIKPTSDTIKVVAGAGYDTEVQIFEDEG